MRNTKVYNFSNEPIFLKTNQKFGTVEEVEYAQSESPRIKITPSVNSVTPEERFEFLKTQLNLDNSNLSEQQKSELQDFIFEHSDIFSTVDHYLAETGLVKHIIDTQDSKPIYQRPYRANT